MYLPLDDTAMRYEDHALECFPVLAQQIPRHNFAPDRSKIPGRLSAFEAAIVLSGLDATLNIILVR